MILVTGATGKSGGEVVRRLAARGEQVRGLARDPAKAEALAGLPNVEIVQGDLAQPDTLGAALRGVERAMLISTSAPDMQVVQTNFITAARAAGVRYVVKLSGILFDPHSPFRYARMHAAIEQALEASGLAFTHLRAGEFFTAYFRQVRSIVTRGAIALPMADARIASIDIGDVAEVAVRVLTSAGHEGQAYAITGPESLTMGEVAERLTAAIGKPVQYLNVAPEDARQAQLAAGMPPYTADALFELFAERRKGLEAKVSDTIPNVFGWQPMSFSEFAKANAAIFRGEQPAPRV